MNQLADGKAGVELQRHRSQAHHLERDATLPAGVDRRRGEVHQQTEPGPGTLPFDSRGQRRLGCRTSSKVCRQAQPHDLERLAEDEVLRAGLQLVAAIVDLELLHQGVERGSDTSLPAEVDHCVRRVPWLREQRAKVEID